MSEPALQAGPHGWTDKDGKWHPCVVEAFADLFLRRFCDNADDKVKGELGFWGLMAITELARQTVQEAAELAFRHGYYFGAMSGDVSKYNAELFADWNETAPPEDIREVLKRMAQQ